MSPALASANTALAIAGPTAPRSVHAIIDLATKWDAVRRADGAFVAPAIDALRHAVNHAQHIGDFDGPLGTAMYASLVRWVRAWVEASAAVRAGPLNGAVAAMLDYAVAVCAGTHAVEGDHA